MRSLRLLALALFVAAAAMYLAAQTGHAAGLFVLGLLVEGVAWVQLLPHDDDGDDDSPRPPG